MRRCAPDHHQPFGVITDQTGTLSFTGIANVNVAKMVIDDLNDRGGLLGRPAPPVRKIIPISPVPPGTASCERVMRAAAGHYPEYAA